MKLIITVGATKSDPQHGLVKSNWYEVSEKITNFKYLSFLTMSEMVADLELGVKNRLKRLPHFDKLVFVSLFGSQVHGKTTERSDIDLCLYYNLKREELEELSLKLSSHFPEKYDISLFQLLPVQVRKEILKGKFLYVSDRDKLFDIVYKTLTEYRFFKPLYRKVIY